MSTNTANPLDPPLSKLEPKPSDASTTSSLTTPPTIPTAIPPDSNITILSTSLALGFTTLILTIEHTFIHNIYIADGFIVIISTPFIFFVSLFLFRKVMKLVEEWKNALNKMKDQHEEMGRRLEAMKLDGDKHSATETHEKWKARMKKRIEADDDTKREGEIGEREWDLGGPNETYEEFKARLQRRVDRNEELRKQGIKVKTPEEDEAYQEWKARKLVELQREQAMMKQEEASKLRGDETGGMPTSPRANPENLKANGRDSGAIVDPPPILSVLAPSVQRARAPSKQREASKQDEDKRSGPSISPHLLLQDQTANGRDQAATVGPPPILSVLPPNLRPTTIANNNNNKVNPAPTVKDKLSTKNQAPVTNQLSPITTATTPSKPNKLTPISSFSPSLPPLPRFPSPPTHTLPPLPQQKPPTKLSPPPPPPHSPPPTAPLLPPPHPKQTTPPTRPRPRTHVRSPPPPRIRSRSPSPHSTRGPSPPPAPTPEIPKLKSFVTRRHRRRRVAPLLGRPRHVEYEVIMDPFPELDTLGFEERDKERKRNRAGTRGEDEGFGM